MNIDEEVKPRIERWRPMGYEAKSLIVEYLKGLTRVELMDFQDYVHRLEFPKEESKFQEALWEAGNDAEWDRDWPIGEEEWKERIPEIVRDTVPMWYEIKDGKTGKYLDLNDLENRVYGMQKKLDKIVKLLESFEITMSVKDALEM